MHIILASQSPRRRELLEQIGLTGFEIRPARGEERADPSLPPDRLVEALSRQKAEEVSSAADPGDLVIAADTVVAVGGRVLGKPGTPARAAEMLASLSGHTHTVYTGITVCRDGRFLTEHEATSVRFRSLSPADISAYVSTGEPLDKAGAYGIQGRGAFLADRIEGSWSTVVGLPVSRVVRALLDCGALSGPRA